MTYSDLKKYYCHNKLCTHVFRVAVYNNNVVTKTTCPECGFLTGKPMPFIDFNDPEIVEFSKFIDDIKAR